MKQNKSIENMADYYFNRLIQLYRKQKINFKEAIKQAQKEVAKRFNKKMINPIIKVAHKFLILKQSEMKIKDIKKEDKGFYPDNKYLFDENGQEIKKARSTYIGHYRGISFYTNPAVKDGVVWYINENQIYRK